MNNKYNNVFTIPNILSFIRIFIVPLIVYIYLFLNINWLVGILLLISGITDLIDGYIARHFNQISDLGKILDPIADKLTLLSILCCSIYEKNILIILLSAELFKDLLVAISSYIRIRSTKKVYSASWYGKLATAMCYCMIILYMFMYNLIPITFTIIIIIISLIISILGFLYAIDNMNKS